MGSGKNRDTRITILIENTVRLPRLKAEHGWAVLVENKHGKILFDTGQSFFRMTAVMKINQAKAMF